MNLKLLRHSKYFFIIIPDQNSFRLSADAFHITIGEILKITFDILINSDTVIIPVYCNYSIYTEWDHVKIDALLYKLFIISY